MALRGFEMFPSGPAFHRFKLFALYLNASVFRGGRNLFWLGVSFSTVSVSGIFLWLAYAFILLSFCTTRKPAWLDKSNIANNAKPFNLKENYLS